MTAPITGKVPSTYQVAKAWLESLDELDGVGVAFTLPDPDTWPSGAFISLATVGGGFGQIAGFGAVGRSLNVPERSPVVQVDCWSYRANSEKPNFGRANELADIVYLSAVRAGQDAETIPVTLPGAFRQVYVSTVFPVGEVRWTPEPDAKFAHFSVDVEFHWIIQGDGYGEPA